VTNSLSVLRQAIDAAGEVIFTTDRAGVFTYVNPQFTKVYGYEADEVVGRETPNILKAGKMPPDFYMKFWQELLEGRAIDVEYINRAKDGRLVTVKASASPVLDGTEIMGFLAIQRDVTEQRRLERVEAQFVQAQKLEAVGRLAGGVAHDFNNILTAILGYVELLLEDVRDERQRRDLEEIRHAGERASALTRQLLAFSRKHVLLPTLIDLNEVVRDLRNMLTRVIGEDVRLTVEFAPDLPVVRADVGRVENALVNLAVNARDAMPSGGHLEIRTATADLDEEFVRQCPGAAPGRFAAVSVTDTGTGISDEVLAHLFEPFFTTKPMGAGTGLGLSSIYGFLQQSRGLIDVTTQIGVGTTVTMYLPQAAVAGSIRSTCYGNRELPTGTETILLVEDDVPIRSVASRILEQHGYRVLPASDVNDAIRIAVGHTGNIDVLLTDVVMPDMNGVDLANRLMGIRPTLRPLLMSGFAHVSESLLVGREWAFLQKPFTAERLLTKVRGVLDGDAA
jgi:two-component system, cell cycle sensor histidine kinase and response regulator CckA